MDALEPLNRSLFLAINAPADTPSWMISIATLVADGLIYLIPVLLVVMWLWGTPARRRLALKATLITLFALGVNQLIGLVWQHPRPFMIDLGHTWIQHAADSSFPSDHVTVFSAIGLPLLLDGAFGFGLVILTAGVAVAWARIYLGVHFPFDMLGAAAVATASYACVAPLWRRYGPATTQCCEWVYHKILALPIQRGWIRE